MNALMNSSRFNLLPGDFSREISRWFDGMDSIAQPATQAAVWAPASIWESDTHYFLEFDLPGVAAEDVDVKILENVLHVTANRPAKTDVTFLRQERPFGTVERQFRLPARVDESHVDAEMTNGILTIQIAKAPEAQVKKIQVVSK